jgi:hypothetical protein
MLFTVGLIGVVLDTLRIAPELLRPALSIARLLGEHAPEPAAEKAP